MKRFLFFSIGFFLCLSFNSCRKKSNDGWNDTANAGIIKIACDENFQNLINAQIDVFEARHNLAIIIPIYTNEDEAIRLLTEDSVRLAVTTRKLNARESREIRDRQMLVQDFLIAFEGIAVLSNIANEDSILGLPTLKKILTGEITEWSQINPQSQLGTIRVLFDGNRSSVLRYVVDSITKSVEALSPNLYAMSGRDELIERVSELPNAIGFLGYNRISNETRWIASGLQNKLRIMRIGSEEEATLQNTYLPYPGDIKEENYPLWRPLYILLSDPRSSLSSRFSVFLSTDVGQTVILKSGLFPAIYDPHNRVYFVTDSFLGE